MPKIAAFPTDLEAIPPPLEGGEEYHVFISHCTADREASELLRDALEAHPRSFKCFHTARDSDSQPGKNEVQATYDAIRSSKRVIILISNNMMKTENWVDFEIWNSHCKSREKGEVVLIPVLIDIEPDNLPCSVKETGFLEAKDEQFWPKLITKLTKTTKMKDYIPFGNVAHGLVWNYYYGFLALVLPDIERKIAESVNFSEVEKKKLLKKLVIVIPEGCVFPRDASEMYLNVEKHEKSIEFQTSRGGKAGRPYNISVYKITDIKTGKEYLVPLDFATPLAAVHQMEMGRLTGLAEEQRKKQVKLFDEKLREILQTRPCVGKALPILIEGKRLHAGEKSGDLVKKLIHHLEQPEQEPMEI